MKTSTDARARRGWLKNEMRRETLTWRRDVKLRRAGVQPGIVTDILAASGGQKRKPSTPRKLLTAKNAKDAKKQARGQKLS
jgi:hypothetical protein